MTQPSSQRLIIEIDSIPADIVEAHYMSSKRVSKVKIRAIINRLSASTRGQLFLINLNEAIDNGLLSEKLIAVALSTINLREIKDKREVDLLGIVSRILQNRSNDLLLINSRDAYYDDFSGGHPIVTVMLLCEYNTWYVHPSERTYGHAFSNKAPGTKVTKFLSTARTNPYFWTTPSKDFNPPSIPTSNAEITRDVLGLVHHRKGEHLVALHFKPSPTECYRPTIAEATPNSRFRHINPSYPKEKRWGYTVDLDRLEKSPTPGTDCTGIPELVFKQVYLRACKVDGFYHLGSTKEDRDTNTMDDKFLEHRLSGSPITNILTSLKTRLAP